MTVRLYNISIIISVVALLMLLASVASAGTAFFSYEIRSRGLTKICVYESARGAASITISVARVCPVTIQY